MSVATFKCEFPRRQVMLSVGYDEIEVDEDYRVVWWRETARVPVLVWMTPTSDGMFVVEHQTGECDVVDPRRLTFLGSNELFDQYEWVAE